MTTKKLLRRDTSLNCRCPAYNFPHRPSSGRCQAPKEGQLVCSECWGVCKGTYVDQGIGPYEFWGRKGYDTRMVWVSECCEADLLTPTGGPAEQPDNRDEDQPSNWRPHHA